jgi:hypothetical protein
VLTGFLFLSTTDVERGWTPVVEREIRHVASRRGGGELRGGGAFAEDVLSKNCFVPRTVLSQGRFITKLLGRKIHRTFHPGTFRQGTDFSSEICSGTQC